MCEHEWMPSAREKRTEQFWEHHRKLDRKQWKWNHDKETWIQTHTYALTMATVINVKMFVQPRAHVTQWQARTSHIHSILFNYYYYYYVQYYAIFCDMRQFTRNTKIMSTLNIRFVRHRTLSIVCTRVCIVFLFHIPQRGKLTFDKNRQQIHFNWFHCVEQRKVQRSNSVDSEKNSV